MIALEVELLTGRYVATSFSDRAAPEWPPHPARLFSALVATAHEHAELTTRARSALQWLEKQGPPHIQASQAARRAVVTMYVPGNTTRVLGSWATQEEKVLKARAAAEEVERTGNERERARAMKQLVSAEEQLQVRMLRAVEDDGRYSADALSGAQGMLPDRRGKQPKTLPSVTPCDARVRYVWPESVPDGDVGATLAELAKRVVRLGHSSSLVACRFLSGPAVREVATSEHQEWEPVEEGAHKVRTFRQGQLVELEKSFERHRGTNPRVLPFVQQSYRIVGEGSRETLAGPVFGEWLVLREVEGEDGRRSGIRLQRTEDIARAIRGALLHYADDPAPAVLTGHVPEGPPLDRPHIAFLALADIGSKHASGTVLGAAIVLPKGIDNADRRAVLRALGRWEAAGLRLHLGRLGELKLERVTDEEPRRTLDPSWWTRPSRRWASVTPVALDRNPGNLFSRDPGEVSAAVAKAEEIVATACEYVGLPRPKWVEVVRRSLFDAAPAARDYMPFPKKAAANGGLRRVCVHVELCFDEPVVGPVLIGAGRYFGVGLCRGRG